MGGIIGAGPLRSTGVVRVVKAVLLGSSDVLNQIVSRLVCHIRVLLKEDGVLRNLVGNLVVWVLRVFNAEGQVMGCSTLWWCFRVAVSMMGGRPVGARVVWKASLMLTVAVLMKEIARKVAWEPAQTTRNSVMMPRPIWM